MSEFDELEARSLMITDQRPDSSPARKFVDRYGVRMKQFILIIIILSIFVAVFLMKVDILASFLVEHEESIELKEDKPIPITGNERPTSIPTTSSALTQETLNSNTNGAEATHPSPAVSSDTEDIYTTSIPTTSSALTQEPFNSNTNGAEATHLSPTVSSDTEDISTASTESLDRDTDVLQRLNMLVAAASEEFEESRREQYGTFAKDTFKKDLLLEYFHSPSDKSVERLKQRLKIKLLKAQLEEEPINYTYVVGGHSSAAGHGNLLSQSYAGIVEKVLQPIFRHFDITMYGKNYAMGGTSSAPEIAMCLNAIFGLDLDIVVWDYGMLDSTDFALYNLFTQRVGVHPTMPSVFSIRAHMVGMEKINSNVEAAGMAVFRFEPKSIAQKHFPDSDTHPNLDELPPGVKYFVCSGHVESGEPCSTKPSKYSNKWNTLESCSAKPVGYQAKWHAGFKSHLFTGYLQASFIFANLQDAITELSKEISTMVKDDTKDGPTSIDAKAKEYMESLIAMEDNEKEMFKNSTVPQHYRNVPIAEFGTDNYSVFQRSNSFCHTARLPSQSRYDGLVTESGKVASYVGYGRTTYEDEGFSSIEILPSPDKENNNTLPWLLYSASSREICEHAEIDFKDCFLIRNSDSWMTMIVPNDAEMSRFSIESDEDMKGYVMLCTRYYDFKRYPPSYMRVEDLFDANITAVSSIEINGAVATGFLDLGKLCYVLKNGDGYRFPLPTDDKRGFEIKIRVPQEGKMLYLSSVVVL